MAKILISPLGKGNEKREYRSANYRFQDSEKTYETSFIAGALVQELKPDKIIFIGTSKSMWEECYRFFAENGGVYNETEYFKIAEAIEDYDYNSVVPKELLKSLNIAVDEYLMKINPSAKGGSKEVFIKYGLNQQELWDNFDSFMNIDQYLEHGDEIYLDITHSFRSIPMFMYLMMDFFTTLSDKKIKLSGIYYGMLDIKNEVGYAPVVDLKVLFEISNWIKGAYSFINYGNGFMIAEMTKDENIKKHITNITELLQINYLVDLQVQLKNLNKELIKLEEKVANKQPISESPAFSYILPNIEKMLKRLSKIENPADFQLELSGWFFENKNFSNGYICLAEAIVTKICEVYKMDIKNRDYREFAKKNLRIFAVLRKKGGVYNTFRDLGVFSEKISLIRNRIAHASFIDNQGSYRLDINHGWDCYNKAKNFFANPDLYKIPDEFPKE